MRVLTILAALLFSAMPALAEKLSLADASLGIEVEVHWKDSARASRIEEFALSLEPLEQPCPFHRARQLQIAHAPRAARMEMPREHRGIGRAGHPGIDFTYMHDRTTSRRTRDEKVDTCRAPIALVMQPAGRLADCDRLGQRVNR